MDGGGINQRLNPLSMDGSNRGQFVESQGSKFIDLRGYCGSIDLIDGHNDRFAAATELMSYFPVERDHAFLHIDHKNNGIGRLDGQINLLDGRACDDIESFFAAKQADPARINECKKSPTPFDFSGDAIARNAGLIMNDGNPAPCHAIEQRWFSNVWATDDGDKPCHEFTLERCERRPKTEIQLAISCQPLK